MSAYEPTAVLERSAPRSRRMMGGVFFFGTSLSGRVHPNVYPRPSPARGRRERRKKKAGGGVVGRQFSRKAT